MFAVFRRWGPLFVGVLLCLLLFALMGVGGKARAVAGDEQTGSSRDLSDDLAEEVGHTEVAVNLIWVFLGAILVFFVQAGFAMVETGFAQKRNAVHMVMTNFTIFAIGTLGYYLMGCALMFGGSARLPHWGEGYPQRQVGGGPRVVRPGPQGVCFLR